MLKGGFAKKTNICYSRLIYMASWSNQRNIKPVKKLIIDEDYCKGCGLCVIACPLELITVGKKVNKQGYPLAQISDDVQEECTACSACARMCPDAAISVYRSKKD